MKNVRYNKGGIYEAVHNHVDPTHIPLIKINIDTKLNKDHANIQFHRNPGVTW